jgi:hypothetical protein
MGRLSDHEIVAGIGARTPFLAQVERLVSKSRISFHEENEMNTSTALIAFALLCSMEGGAGDTHAPSASEPPPNSPLESQWIAAEMNVDVDPMDLCSIALQESRRHRPDGYLRQWPWTLHIPAEGAPSRRKPVPQGKLRSPSGPSQDIAGVTP